MLLYRCASFVAKTLTELSSANVFPARTARAEDPGLSKAKVAAEAVPAESVRLKRNEEVRRKFLDSHKSCSQIEAASSDQVIRVFIFS
ncbi:hypothetical protein EEX84_02135 [Planococcus salinus]|uniref:Uncharacterized protein n=1 Tax=Planococcus salinus TaxID=1848460 RepID=A0A3M8PBT1_9BACL|nr:hypothetical protein EEX84_02135 [Planococcus salinus]